MGKAWPLSLCLVLIIQAGAQTPARQNIAGTGRASMNDLQPLMDSRSVTQASSDAVTVLDTDKEFDGGSRISLSSLTGTQIKNLATLAKVWGFLKYHHPAITSGQRHWDYDLFRVLPAVLAAADSVAANDAISAWIANLGEVEPCAPCARLETSDLHLRPNLDWISDEALLGAGLSQTLKDIYQNRTPARQFYVSLSSSPVFEHELVYETLELPDAGYQLLALFRFWNMVQYFYPYRDVMADDPAASPNYWSEVLEQSIPGIALAKDRLAYNRELMKFIVKINDTHANLWTSLAMRPPVGSCQLPVDVRFVEGVPLVFRYTSASAGPDSGLEPGDIIERLDGIAVSELISQWRPYYADSNEAARLRDIGRYMTRGACGPVEVVVQRGDTSLTVSATRVATSTLDLSVSAAHDLPGATFQKLSADVAYVKLSSMAVARVPSSITSAAGTKGLIIDIRNYPLAFVVFALGSRLVPTMSDFAAFTGGDLSNPGAFHWRAGDLIKPVQPRYQGKVVILVDEVTQSQAEYTAMAFRAAPGAIVIGSTTAGADGNVSTVPLPGNLGSYISGTGVFYPDQRPTQRVGIVPDIEVKPTIEGIRAGRDELIEEAIRQITQ